MKVHSIMRIVRIVAYTSIAIYAATLGNILAVSGFICATIGEIYHETRMYIK